jgi:hypothetical protein
MLELPQKVRTKVDEVDRQTRSVHLLAPTTYFSSTRELLAYS